MWLFILVPYLSIIISFYRGKKKTVKIIEKKVTHFSDTDTGDAELLEIITDPLGEIKTCESWFELKRGRYSNIEMLWFWNSLI